MRVSTLTPRFTEFIPRELEPETLYVSMHYRTVAHLCACGCNHRVITPLGEGDWTLTFDGTVTLDHSVGSGQQPCRSHYLIRNDRVIWLPQITAAATQAASLRDRSVHAAKPKAAWWQRAWNRARNISRRLG